MQNHVGKLQQFLIKYGRSPPTYTFHCTYKKQKIAWKCKVQYGDSSYETNWTTSKRIAKQVVAKLILSDIKEEGIPCVIEPCYTQVKKSVVCSDEIGIFVDAENCQDFLIKFAFFSDIPKTSIYSYASVKNAHNLYFGKTTPCITSCRGPDAADIYMTFEIAEKIKTRNLTLVILVSKDKFAKTLSEILELRGTTTILCETIEEFRENFDVC